MGRVYAAAYLRSSKTIITERPTIRITVIGASREPLAYMRSIVGKACIHA